MVPIGALAQIEATVGPAVITLYNLYPAATIYGSASAGFSSGQAMNLMEQIAAQNAAARRRLRMDSDVLSGKSGRQSDLLCFRIRPAVGISLPRGAIRKLDCAVGGDPVGTAGAGRAGIAFTALVWPTRL